MAAEPRLLLLDEPFRALEADLRIRTREAITEIVAIAGTTAVLVTHDPDDAATFAPRVLYMDRGRTITSDLELAVAAAALGTCPTCGQPIHDTATVSTGPS
jgi:ABC-type sulfate/molybdate transport systems ATPase subunit